MASTSAALEGLPKQFVVAMKTLFEVMDDRKSGYVKLSGLIILINFVLHHLARSQSLIVRLHAPVARLFLFLFSFFFFSIIFVASCQCLVLL